MVDSSLLAKGTKVRRELAINFSLTNPNHHFGLVQRSAGGPVMSKMDMSTQDIFLRLGGTSQSRSAKADAVFRRLRFDQAAQISDALARAPKWIDVEEEDAAVIAASNKD